MSVNRLKSTRIFGELIVQDLSGNTNANTILNRDLSVTGKITTPKIVSPFNPLVNLSFLSSLPTTAVADSNAGQGLFWNQSGGQGETDLILYGQGGPGGLALYAANNSIAPYVFCKLYPSLIEFAATPTFPTSNTIGAIGATTQYINNVLSSYLTGATAALTYQPITLMGDYLTTITATATYLTQSSAASIYQTISNMSNYITKGGDIPLNNNAKLSFPSSYPSTAVNNNNSGIGFYWNNSNQFGETDLLCYGKTAKGGLTISTAGNTTIPFTIAAFLRDYITFFYAPEHPTNTTVGDISATTQYVNDRLTIITAQQSSNNTMITNLSNQVLALQTAVQANNVSISTLNTNYTVLKARVDALYN
jgi:hypothetical protein